MPQIIHPPDEAQLIARAVQAWGVVRNGIVDIRQATVQEHNGRRYVLLPRRSDAPVVYRIHNDGGLRRLHRRIPPELLEETTR